MTTLLDFDELDLSFLWMSFRERRMVWRNYPRAPRTRAAFLSTLHDMVTDPDRVRTVQFCDDCYNPGHEGDMYTPRDRWVCEDCYTDYSCCDSCGIYFNDLTGTMGESEVCRVCRDRHYAWCGGCSGWYWRTDGGHDHTACCESPVRAFTIPNDGKDPLAEDTRAKVTLAAGEITDEGIFAITNYLRKIARPHLDDINSDAHKLWSLSYHIGDLGTTWQTRKGNYTKRLSHMAYQSQRLKISPQILSQVGCIASDHSAAVDFDIEVTRNLNLSASSFGHFESCWWQSYSASRCAFKTNGGFAIRTFGPRKGTTGRAWVLPLRSGNGGWLVPTFETMQPAAYVTFNGYGKLVGYTPARILSHMTGWTYRKIEFTCSPMYVNSSSGYLVAPEELAEKYTDGRLNLSVDTHSDLFKLEQLRLKKKVLINA